jgi:hypothetical protein
VEIKIRTAVIAGLIALSLLFIVIIAWLIAMPKG